MIIFWGKKAHTISFSINKASQDKDDYIMMSILRKRLVQGKQYQELQKHMRLIFTVLQENFTEDNYPTTEAFMIECLDATTRYIGCKQEAKL